MSCISKLFKISINSIKNCNIKLIQALICITPAISYSEDFKIAYFETDIDIKHIFNEEFDYQGSLIKANDWSCSGRFNSKKIQGMNSEMKITKSDLKTISMTCSHRKLDVSTDFQLSCGTTNLLRQEYFTFRKKSEYKSQLNLVFICYDDEYQDNIFYKNEKERVKFLRSIVIVD